MLWGAWPRELGGCSLHPQNTSPSSLLSSSPRCRTPPRRPEQDRREFRDRSPCLALAKGIAFGLARPLPLTHTHTQTPQPGPGTPTVRNPPLFQFYSPVSVVHHLYSVRAKPEEGCPLRGSPRPPKSVHPDFGPPHTHRTLSTSKGLPSARPLCSLPMLCPPPGPTRGHLLFLLLLGPRALWGQGPSWGTPGKGGGGQGRRCSVTSRWCPWCWGPGRRRRGAWRVLFSIFYFQIFLYLNLQICIIQDTNKGRYNGIRREGGILGRGVPQSLSGAPS